jgi:asparagine synthase (glutamine-hydrolysing)
LCGIFGIIQLERAVSESTLRELTDTMKHRGPDDAGYWTDRNVGLAHRRLSIIDLSKAGRNPMSNADQTLWTTFNGEIYNFAEHRQLLIAKGHRFRSRTDTEVVLHLYEEHGESCVEHLRGMFAFAMWDVKNRRLFLARDRFGIKPLYYLHTPKLFMFASEIVALLQYGELAREASLPALDTYLSLQYIPSPHTIFKHIYKLPPAHTLTVEVGDSNLRVGEPKRYFALVPQPDFRRSEKNTIEQARVLLEESIQLHLVSDVPVGAFLSGGVDSSAIVSVMSSVFNQPVTTFSVGFEDPKYNELAFARQIATKFETDHHELVVTADCVRRGLGEVSRCMGEPLGDPSAFNNYFVSQVARQHVTVALAGDGGDEAFAGYERYEREQRVNGFTSLPPLIHKAISKATEWFPVRAGTSVDGLRRLRNLVYRASLPPARRYLERMRVFDRLERIYLYKPEFLAAVKMNEPVSCWMESTRCGNGDGDRIVHQQWLDLHTYIPEDLMLKADRMSMCHSLEVRVPFLDHKLLEFAMTIPSSLNVRGRGNRKVILKKAIWGLVPQEAMDRPKQGFALPYGDWLRGPLREIVQDTLLSPCAWLYEFLNPEYVAALVQAQKRGRFGTDWRVWSLLALEMWAQTYLKRAGK